MSEPIQRLRSAEMTGGPGFRVRQTITRATSETIARLSRFPSSDVSDVLNRMFTLDPAIRCLTGNITLAGPAVTVKVFPGDNLMLHKSLDVAEPGDVVVVDTCGSHRNAVFGDLLANKGKHRGIAGYIIDGYVRDIDGILETDLPVFARGVTSLGPLHRGPGEVNFPVSCGGVVVSPGDVMVADSDGIVVVQNGFSARAAAALEAQEVRNADYVQNVKNGIFSNDWVDAQLSASDCEYLD